MTKVGNLCCRVSCGNLWSRVSNKRTIKGDRTFLNHLDLLKSQQYAKMTRTFHVMLSSSFFYSAVCTM